MEPVYTYKSLNSVIFLYGFQPIDFFVVIVCPLLVGVAVSYIAGAASFVGLWFIAKKLKKRPPGYFSLLYLFFVTPCYFVISPQNDEISYRDALK